MKWDTTYEARSTELVMIISYPANPNRIIVLLKTQRHIIENLKKKVKERNAALEKTERIWRKKSERNERSFKENWKKGISFRSNVINKRARKPFDMLQRFWSELNEFNETSGGERKRFAFEKKYWIYRLWTVVNGQWSCKNDFNHCLTGWNSFQRPHIDVQAEESEFQTSVPFANLIKMKTRFQFILVNWNITSPKMVTSNILEGISNGREISRLCFKK